MEYIYEFIERSDEYKACLNITKELQSLDDAQSVDISVLRQNIAGIGNKLKRIKRRIENKAKITRMGDNFNNIMQPFYVSAIAKFQELEKKRDEIFKSLKDLGIWFNEPKDANFKYLKTLNEFRQNLLRSIKNVKAKKEKEAEIAKRK